MKVLRKILACVITAAISSTLVVPVNAATISFDAKLSQIESLIQQCAAKGIDTSYEQVAYHTVKRTQSKLIADNNSGTDTDIVTYNNTKMNEMLDTAISDLQAYLNGTKKAKRVSLPNINNTEIAGSGLISGNKPVFSVGYGHQPISLEPDVQDMNKFGSTNIHLEAGPAQIKSFSNPFNFEQNATDTVIEYDASTSHSGTYSLKVTNNTEKSVSYARLTKNIPCEPNTKYVLSVWTKYETENTDGLYLLMRRDWVEPTAKIADGVTGTASQGWTNNTITVTTDAGQNSFELSLIVEGKCTLWVDDMSVRKEGTTTELFYNGTLDEYDLLDDASSSINTTIKSAIQKAKANNVGVEFLLSPHYFPGTKYFTHTLKVAGVEYGEDRESTEGAFLSYNVANENAKKVMADHIKGLFAWFNENNLTPAIHSIILSNEPIFRTTWFSDYYAPLFRSFLAEKYGTISALNSELGTSYSSFDAVSMPAYTTDCEDKKGIDYDWVEFNDEVFVSWHEFLAKEVKKRSDKPVSIKAGYAFETSGANTADRLTKGYDFEKLGKFVDISGFDQTEMLEHPHTYWTNMMFYDYLDSVVKKPMYNSETHFNVDAINDEDGNFSYNAKTANHARNHLWMSAAHGVDMFSNWCWDEGGQVPYTLLSRPDVINKIGATALDMARLSTNITDINNKKPQVAMFYSRASRMYQPMHVAFMIDVYRTLASMGVKVGFVTEDNLDLLDSYDALVLPAVKYTTDAARSKVNAFIARGGKVLSINNQKNSFSSAESPMSSDEHKNSATAISATISTDINSGGFLGIGGFDEYSSDGPDSNIEKAVKNFVEKFVTREITVTDGSGNEVSELDWSYVVDGESLVINVSNVDVNSTSKTLKFYKNGEQIVDMNNMITGETGVSSVTANLYEPVMLYIGATNQVSLGTTDLKFINKELSGRINITNEDLMDGERIVVKVEAYNNSDVIREYQYVKTIVPMGGTDGFNTIMALASDVAYVKIFATNEDGDVLLAPATKLYVK